MESAAQFDDFIMISTPDDLALCDNVSETGFGCRMEQSSGENAPEDAEQQGQCCLPVTDRCFLGCLQIHSSPHHHSRKTCTYCFLVQIGILLLHFPCVICDLAIQLIHRVQKRHKRVNAEHPEIHVPPADTPGLFSENSYDVYDEALEDYQTKARRLVEMSELSSTSRVWRSIVSELMTICRNDFVYKLKVWIDILKPDVNLDCQNLLVTILAESVVMDKEMTSTALVKQYPGLVLQHITGNQHAGLTAFHLAIIYKRHSLLVTMMRCLDDETRQTVLHLRAQILPGTDPENRPTTELPLSLAIMVGVKDTLELLVMSGAELVLQDRGGNNAIHTVVTMATVNKELALRALHTLADLLEEWASRTNICSFLQEMKPVNRLVAAKRMLLFAQNFDGYTPLKLAAKVGCPELVNKLMNIDDVYRFDFFDCGAKFSASYDMSEMDPFLMATTDLAPTVMEIVAFQHESDEGLKIFEVPTAQKVFKEKVKNYKSFLVIGSLLHIIIISFYNVTAYYVLFPRLLTLDQEDDNSTSGTGVMPQKASSRRFQLVTFDYVLIFFSMLYGSHCLLTCHFVGIKVRKRNNISVLKGRSLLHVLMTDTFFYFTITSILYSILKISGCQYEVFFLANLLFVGTICVFLYTRLFKTTAIFTIMMERVFLRDMARFLAVIIIIIIAFSIAALTLLAVDNDLSDDGLYLVVAAINLFRFATGVSDIADQWKGATYNAALKILYFHFIITINITMMNLLIAAMNSTYARIIQSTHLLYQQVQFRDVCTFEAIAPAWLSKRTLTLYSRRTITYDDVSGVQRERQLYLMKVDTTVKPKKSKLM